MIFFRACGRHVAAIRAATTSATDRTSSPFGTFIVGMHKFGDGVHHGQRRTCNEYDVLDVHFGQRLDELQIEGLDHIALFQPAVLGNETDQPVKGLVPHDGLSKWVIHYICDVKHQLTATHLSTITAVENLQQLVAGSLLQKTEVDAGIGSCEMGEHSVAGYKQKLADLGRQAQVESPTRVFICPLWVGNQSHHVN